MLMSSYAEATRAGIRGFAWEVQILAQPWGFRLEDIPIEVHLWHGEEDTSTPLAMGQYLADAIPHCHAHFLAGEGHFLLFTHWAGILAVLLGE
jgi:pimeloyl-ACP methyl ester carboxylesterase